MHNKRYFKAISWAVISAQISLSSSASLAGPFDIGGITIAGISDLNHQISTLNDSIVSMNSQWAQANPQLAAMNSNWAASNVNWTATNDQLAQLRVTGDSMSSQIAQLNSSFNQTQSYIQQTLTPLNAFTFAAAAGAGFALGGLAVSIATKGLAFAAEALHEKLTHRERNKIMSAEFDEALKKYETLAPATPEIEKRIETYLELLDLFERSEGGYNEMLKQMRILKHHLSVQAELLHDALKHVYRMGEEPDAQFHQNTEVLNEMIAAVDEKQEAIAKFMDALSRVPQSQICERLNTEIAVLIRAENTLQMARATMLDPLGETIWEEKFNRDVKKATEINKRLSDPKQLVKKDEYWKKAARERNEAFILADPVKKNEALARWHSCISTKSRIGNVPVLGHLFAYKVRKSCWLEVIDPVDHSSEESHSNTSVSLTDPELVEEAVNTYHDQFTRMKNLQAPDRIKSRLKDLRLLKIAAQQYCSIDQITQNK